MAILFGNDLDLEDLHEILGFKPEGRTDDPSSPNDGRIWHRTDLNQIRVRLDGSTETLATGTSSPASESTAGVAELATQAETDTGTDDARIITPLKLAQLALANMAWFIDDDSMASAAATTVPSSESVKAYVDNNVTALWTDQGTYNASTNTPDLDTSPSGIEQGDTYTVSVAGTFFTEAVEAGDVLKADQDDPTALAHWTVINRNLDQATETVAGVAELATQAEVTTGTDDDRMVTPLKLATHLGGFGAVHQELIGDGSTNPITVTHNLGNDTPMVALRRVSDGVLVIPDATRVSANAVSVAFATDPTTDQYQVTVIG